MKIDSNLHKGSDLCILEFLNFAEKDSTILKINNCIREKKYEEAIALFRHSRCKWKDDTDIFGYEGIPVVEEFVKLKSIFTDDSSHEINALSATEAHHASINNIDYVETSDISSIFKDLLSQYATPYVVKIYGIVFAKHDTNTEFQNKCCMNMFSNIKDKCDLGHFLFDLRLFTIINDFYKDPLRQIKKTNDSLTIHFFQELLKAFFKNLNKNKNLLYLLLFHKNNTIISFKKKIKKQNKKKNVMITDQIIKDVYEKHMDLHKNKIEVLESVFNELNVSKNQKEHVMKRLQSLGFLNVDESFLDCEEHKNNSKIL